MRINIKDIKVYLISPCTGMYKDRVFTVLDRLVSHGFKRIEIFKSAEDAVESRHAAILELEKDNNDKPFLILEDTCNLYNIVDGYEWIDVPDDAGALYVGVSNPCTTLPDTNNDLVRIKSMSSTHAILYTNKRSTLAEYALKRPIFYQDKNIGGHEDATRLVYNGTCYTFGGVPEYHTNHVVCEQLANLEKRDPVHSDRVRIAYVLRKLASDPRMPSDMLTELLQDPKIEPILWDAKIATDCGWSPAWAAKQLRR